MIFLLKEDAMYCVSAFHVVEMQCCRKAVSMQGFNCHFPSSEAVLVLIALVQLIIYITAWKNQAAK